MLDYSKINTEKGIIQQISRKCHQIWLLKPPFYQPNKCSCYHKTLLALEFDKATTNSYLILYSNNPRNQPTKRKGTWSLVAAKIKMPKRRKYNSKAVIIRDLGTKIWITENHTTSSNELRPRRFWKHPKLTSSIRKLWYQLMKTFLLNWVGIHHPTPTNNFNWVHWISIQDSQGITCFSIINNQQMTWMEIILSSIILTYTRSNHHWWGISPQLQGIYHRKFYHSRDLKEHLIK